MSNTTAGTLVKGAAPTPYRRVHTVYERDALRFQANVFGVGQMDRENFGIGTSGATPTDVPWLRKNRTRLNEQQKTVMKVLEDSTPETTTPEERDKISRRCEALKEQFSPFLQTRAEIRALDHRDPVFMDALDKASAWSKKQEELGGRSPEELCEEYRNLKRRLDPENPQADSVEKFRRSK